MADDLRARGRRAFSLTELLVAFGIVAVLIAILLPALSGIRRTAQRSACLANLRGIGLALAAYHSETRLVPDVVLATDDGIGGSVLLPRPDRPALADVLADYLDTPAPQRSAPGDTSAPWVSGPPWVCPADAGYLLNGVQDPRFDTAWRWDGSSYELGPVAILFNRLSIEFPTATRGAIQRAATRGLERRNWMFLSDADDWHPPPTRRNGLNFPDGSVGEYTVLGPGEFDAFADEVAPILHDAP